MISVIFGSLDFQLGNPNRLKIPRGWKYVCIYHLNTKIRSTILISLSGFELYSHWVPLRPYMYFSEKGIMLMMTPPWLRYFRFHSIYSLAVYSLQSAVCKCHTPANISETIAKFWRVVVLDVVLSEYLNKSHNFKNFIFYDVTLYCRTL